MFLLSYASIGKHCGPMEADLLLKKKKSKKEKVIGSDDSLPTLIHFKRVYFRIDLNCFCHLNGH